MFSINFKSWAFLVFALPLKWFGGWDRMDGGFVVGMCLLKGWLAASVRGGGCPAKPTSDS